MLEVGGCLGSEKEISVGGNWRNVYIWPSVWGEWKEKKKYGTCQQKD